MVKISQMDPETAPTSLDYVPIVDAETNQNKRITFYQLAATLLGESEGWTSIGASASVASGYNKGNKEFDITTSGSMANILTPGMRFNCTRGTAAPTQCFDAESSSSHYASRASGSLTGLSFTDDITIETWVKFESYTANNPTAIGRYGTGGWFMRFSSSGQIVIYGENGSAQADFAQSWRSVPLNRWVHVAATLDMSGATATMYMDGELVANNYTNSAATAFVQSGNLEVGRVAASNYFDGKLSDIRVWSAVRTATQIRDNMNQQLVGTETNLVIYYKLNGNFNDSTASANNLTAQNSAVATDADNPMKDIEYAIVVKVNGTTTTLFTGSDHTIPNMTLSSPEYSKERAPFGFPADEKKWQLIISWPGSASLVTGSIAGAWSPFGSVTVSMPLGVWNQRTKIVITGSSSTPATFSLQTQWDTASPTVNKENQHVDRANTSVAFLVGTHRHIETIDNTVQQAYNLYAAMASGAGTQTAYLESSYTHVLTLTSAYV